MNMGIGQFTGVGPTYHEPLPEENWLSLLKGQSRNDLHALYTYIKLAKNLKMHENDIWKWYHLNKNTGKQCS